MELALRATTEKRVLSIQSHVVHGFAGNKCAVFPLQLHGFDVDAINSVQFSNHAGNVDFLNLPQRYAHLKGQKLSEAELSELYEGLKLNNVDNYTHILTGYCADQSFLKKIANIVNELKEKNSDVIYVCDPVMGDNGRYYTPKELMPIYRDVVIPLADVLTPNAFELGELTGMTIRSEEECLAGIDVLHAKGVRTVVVTSGVEGAQSDSHLVAYASTKVGTSELQRYRFVFPRLKGQFVGTGDTFTSLLVVWLDRCNGDIAEAVGRVLGTMQALIKKTSSYALKQAESKSRAMCELQLIQARADLLVPEIIIPAEHI